MKILLTGGGTAGHVTPSLTLIPHLQKHFDSIYYIGSNGIEKSLLEKTGIPFYEITCEKLNRSFTPKNFLMPFKVLKGIRQAKKILKTLSPDVVFSKGGYVGLPVTIASKKLKIPVVCHESDFTVGLANKISSRFSVKTLTAFSSTAKRLKNGEYVGLPIKKGLNLYDKSSALREFSFNDDKPVLLVFGGSQGARKINEIIYKSLDELKKTFNILHVTGRDKTLNYIKCDGYTPIPFIDKMEKAYSVADVIVSRSGATSAFEILSLKKPVVFIPLSSSASRGDQVQNAEYFAKKGLCYQLNENILTTNSLIFAVKSAYLSKKLFYENDFLIEDASQKIVDILVAVASNNNHTHVKSIKS